MSAERPTRSRVTESSVVVRLLRSLGRAIVKGRPPVPAEAVAAARREADARVSLLLHESRIVRSLLAAIDVPIRAWRSSAARRVAGDFLGLDLAVRFRLLGQAMLAAVITHTLVLAALRVPVLTIGWTARGVIALAGLALVVRPDIFAAAWLDRASRRKT